MKKNTTIQFPSGIAEGNAFCNRHDERKQLQDNIQNLKHTVLMAPRRYGKTSLIRQVMLEQKNHHAWSDFLSVTSQQETENKIKKTCKSLLFQLAPELKKIQLRTKELVKTISPELNLSAMGQSLSLSLNSNDAIEIDELLVQLDEYAQKVGKTAILVFDEFQQLSEIEQHQHVEALIRHAVERSKAITYIFSGSNRHLLAKMFSDSNRPLYRLCQIMTLNRIKAQEYQLFLNKAAQTKWQCALKEEVFEKIIQLTQCHSFYINVLCAELWRLEQAPSTTGIVESTWQHYIENHKSIIIADIISLPLNQKRILTTLAKAPTQTPYGAKFSFASKLPASSIRRAIKTLLEKDIIYIDPDQFYCLLDPAIKYYLVKN